MTGKGPLKRRVIRLLATSLFLVGVEGRGFAAALPKPGEIFAKMRDTYQRIEGYRTETEVAEYRHGELEERKAFLYSFRKPRHFRIEMHTPHKGAILVCCDRGGKVVVHPGGLGAFLTVRLAPDSRLFGSGSGQRLDQTDLGLLIDNIGHTLTDAARGEVKVSEEDGRIVLETTAQDHFLPGVITRYRYLIDRKSWLPAGVVERTPEGVLKRVVSFRNLEPRGDFPEGFFDTDGEGGEGSGR